MQRTIPLLISLCAAALPALAQTADKSRLMTRDELRACMKLQEQIKTQTTQLDERKSALAADKAKLAPASEQLKTLKAELDAQMAEVKKADAAMREHSARIDAWNAELQEATESKMKSAEARRKQLLRERGELDARNKELLADRDSKLKAYEAAVEQFNSRAKSAEGLVNDWNARNDRWAEDADKLLDMRSNYAADCASRRFREEDEMAIKAGK